MTASKAFRSQLGVIEAGVQKGLFFVGEHTVARAVAIVPHQEGALQNSIVAVVGEGEVIIKADTPYALAQHEHDDWVHTDGRESHYLERPFEEDAALGVHELLVSRGIDETI